MPYPAETEIIANVVTSPHHLSATMVTGRVHRMTELFGRLAPGDNDRERTRRARDGAQRHDARPSGGVPAQRRLPAPDPSPARSDHFPGAGGAADPAGRLGADLRDCLFERRQSHSRQDGAARERAGGPSCARRYRRRAAENVARRKRAAVRRRGAARRPRFCADGLDPVALRRAVLGTCARCSR